MNLLLLLLPVFFVFLQSHVISHEHSVSNELNKDEFSYYLWSHFDEKYELPAKSVWGGFTKSGENVYVGRHIKNNGRHTHLALIIPEKNITYCLIKGKRHIVHNIDDVQVLVARLGTQVQWVHSHKGNISYNTVPVGISEQSTEKQLKVIFVGQSENKQVTEILSSDKCLRLNKTRCEKDYYVLEIVPDDKIDRHPVFINQKYIKWVKSGIGVAIPQYAVVAYARKNNVSHDPIYVGRTFYGKLILPVYIDPANRSAYATYNGKSILARRYEVLVYTPPHPVGWQKYNQGELQSSAIVGGYVDGEDVYIGKAELHDEWILGRIHPTKQCMYCRDYITDKEVCIEPHFILVDTGNLPQKNYYIK